MMRTGSSRSRDPLLRITEVYSGVGISTTASVVTISTAASAITSLTTGSASTTGATTTTGSGVERIPSP